MQFNRLKAHSPSYTPKNNSRCCTWFVLDWWVITPQAKNCMASCRRVFSSTSANKYHKRRGVWLCCLWLQIESR